MLLRFEATNFLSISDCQQISMVASKLKDNVDSLLLFKNEPKIKILPAAIIYGPNASGKTNIINAFSFLRSAILHSHSRGNPEGGVPRSVFALSDKSKDELTRVEVDFIVDDNRYHFGFTCDDKIFHSEWLYSFPEGKKRKLYEREEMTVDFGSTFMGTKKTLVEFMRKNSLFISTATQNDHESLTRIVNFFRKIRISADVSVSPFMLTDYFKEQSIDQRVIDFMNATGAGIVGMTKRNKEISEKSKSLSLDIAALVEKHTGTNISNELDTAISNTEIMLEHQGLNGRYALPLRSESAGTLRLLLMMSAILRALDEGTPIFVDEFDASLHTLVGKQIIDLFLNPELNVNGSQLIATTHDTNILNHEGIRRDQIWLCEKDEFGSTNVLSLADFSLRSAVDFERAYIDGRVGGVPLDGNLQKLVRSMNNDRVTKF